MILCFATSPKEVEKLPGNCIGWYKYTEIVTANVSKADANGSKQYIYIYK